ncbi:hypothetical protein VTJ04DRAFT_2035 [Mycothermus thermophilus]|uniref:uncharacterized protein n=1 Tax=Humicola insolens TaxID=85995 RepID=UPI0037426DAE
MDSQTTTTGTAAAKPTPEITPAPTIDSLHPLYSILRPPAAQTADPEPDGWLHMLRITDSSPRGILGHLSSRVSVPNAVVKNAILFAASRGLETGCFIALATGVLATGIAALFIVSTAIFAAVCPPKKTARMKPRSIARWIYALVGVEATVVLMLAWGCYTWNK